MKNITYRCMAAYLCIFLISCTRSIKVSDSDAVAKYQEAVEETLIQDVKSTDSCIYELEFLAPELLFLKNKGMSATEKDIMEFERHKNDHLVFVLTISPSKYFKLTNGASFEGQLTQTTENSKYIIEEMKNDFKLISGRDTIIPLFYHHEKLFGLKNSIRIQLGFDKRLISMLSPILLYTNKLLYKPEVVSFEINNETIVNRPKIEI